MRPHWFYAGVCLLCAVHIGLAAVLPPADDELYYWCWSKELQLSYYDHPAMTAVWIRLSTELLGDSLLALRLPAVLSTLGVLLMVGRMTQPRDLLLAAALTPICVFGAILITPDAPLLFFWSAYLLRLIRMQEQSDSGDAPSHGAWLGLGVLLGLGILSKYTMGLAIGCGAAAFLLAGQPRRFIMGWLLHLLTAFIVALPILLFNIEENFAPLRYQWEHTMAAKQPTPKYFGDYLGAQTVMVGLLPLVVLVWAIVRRKELWAEPRLRVCWCYFVLPMMFFLYKALRGRLEANWPLPCYLALCPLGAVWLERCRVASPLWTRLTWACFLIPTLTTLIVAVHLLKPLPLLPARNDIITRQAEKQHLWATIAEVARTQAPGVPIYLPNYQHTAIVRFQGLDGRQVPGMTRASFFTRAPILIEDQQRAIFVHDWQAPTDPPFSPEFDKPKVLAIVPLAVRGETQAFFRVLLYEKRSK